MSIYALVSSCMAPWVFGLHKESVCNSSQKFLRLMYYVAMSKNPWGSRRDSLLETIILRNVRNIISIHYVIPGFARNFIVKNIFAIFLEREFIIYPGLNHFNTSLPMSIKQRIRVRYIKNFIN